MSKAQDVYFPNLVSAAFSVFSDYLQAAPDEKILVVYDKSTTDIADAFKQAAIEADLKLDLRRIEPTGENGSDPDPKTTALLKKYDIVIAPTQFSLTHSAAVTSARKSGARVITMPGITAELFERSLLVDPMELKSSGSLWMKLLAGKHSVEIRSAAGTKISFQIGARPPHNDDGFIVRSGMVGNLPAGEVFLAPDDGSANGIIVFDGSIGNEEWNPELEPAILEIKDGSFCAAKSPRAEQLFKSLDACGPKGRVLAEFGIGTNSALHMSGNLLEDEKVRGTVHFAFGNNCGFGGDNDVPVHIDGIVIAPDLFLDGTQLMRKGNWTAR
ncbi:MAG: hypothetical protein A2X49_12205 [Lentisphaerae bacterium GWF2_52_8]|nr:MAG: hypothetical protein A2X49_12205 [Lentisphaerae bacterium GWF2_52_8]